MNERPWTVVFEAIRFSSGAVQVPARFFAPRNVPPHLRFVSLLFFFFFFSTASVPPFLGLRNIDVRLDRRPTFSLVACTYARALPVFYVSNNFQKRNEEGNRIPPNEHVKCLPVIGCRQPVNRFRAGEMRRKESSQGDTFSTRVG